MSTSSNTRVGTVPFLTPALLGVMATMASCASHAPAEAHAPSTMPKAKEKGSDALSAAVVRYQVSDIERSLSFYTTRLGFSLERRSGDVFASVTRGNLRLLLGGPGSSGSRPMPDGSVQGPGGWNRIVLYVDSLDAQIASLQANGTRFRNEIERGPGGSQILIEDPDGNPVELHQEP